MGIYDFETLSKHIGHTIECVTYGDRNVALECMDCMEVLIDYDIEIS